MDPVRSRYYQQAIDRLARAARELAEAAEEAARAAEVIGDSAEAEAVAGRSAAACRDYLLRALKVAPALLTPEG